MSLNFLPVPIPLSRGVDTEKDPRALEGGLAVCRDIVFDEIGGTQLRKPFVDLGGAILGGGTIADARRLVAHGDELLLFTKDSLYSWSPASSAWVLKGTHLALKVAEQSVFARTSDQSQCDRAEMDGVVVYAWLDTGAATEIHVAALDKATGAVLLTPTQVGTTGTRPKLLAIDTRILLLFVQGTDLYGLSINPASLALSVAASPTNLTPVNSYFDACVNQAGDRALVACRLNPTTSYSVHIVTEAAAVSTSSTKARTCDGPIAIAAAPANTRAQIVRSNGTGILGDLLNSGTLGDVFTGQTIGTASATPVNQIAAAYRDVLNDGGYRCYTFWSADEATDSSSWMLEYNWVDTINGLGTESRLAYRIGVASRAFCHDGHVYVWAVFAGESDFTGAGVAGARAQFQNTYFLYRDDETLCAKATPFYAGGLVPVTGHLPGVQSLGSGAFAWSGTARRIVPLGGGHKGYAARVPRDITFDFDADEARRSVKLGETVYIAGGEILQYDGVGLYEVGFHVYPWHFGAAELASAGSVANGTYWIKVTDRWDNAKGERDRSTTATVGSVTVAAGPNSIQVATWFANHTTHKTDPAITREVWRTLADPVADAPFYLATSQDPDAGSGDNRYVACDYDVTALASFEDALVDADLAKRETNPENGGILENIAPPPATIIAASHDRIFLGGVAGSPHTVWYSKLRAEGEVASFHDVLTVQVPPHGGDLTALAFLDDVLYAFRETAVYALPGDGFDNAGGGQNYGPARRLPSDAGAVSAEAVALTPQGLVFKSRKGWCLLTRGGSVEYIGGPVAAFDTDEVKAVHVLETNHQIRVLTDSRVLTFDYHPAVMQWSEWTVSGGLDATIWDGTYHVLDDANDVLAEQDDFTGGVDYAYDVETAWLNVGGLLNFGKVRYLMFLGEYRSACRVRIRCAYDFEESDASGPPWVDDIYFTVTPTTVGGPLKFRHGPSRPKCQAIKIRITTYAVGAGTPPAGEAVRMTALAMEVGFKRGLYKKLPAAQKQ